MQWTPVAVALWSVLLSGLVPSGYASPGDTLYPAIHWDHDVTNLENLEPGHLGKMYYTHDATAGIHICLHRFPLPFGLTFRAKILHSHIDTRIWRTYFTTLPLFWITQHTS